MGGLYHPDVLSTDFIQRIPGWVISLFLQLFTGLLAVNTLIAVMGDSYDKVKNDYHKYDIQTKISLLQDLNDVYYKNRLEGAPKKMVYLHNIQYLTHGEQTDEWGGKIKSVTKSMDRNCNQIMQN